MKRRIQIITAVLLLLTMLVPASVLERIPACPSQAGNPQKWVIPLQ